MKDEQTRSTIVQWLLPTALLLAAIVGMFIDFFVTSSELAQTQVEKNFTIVMEGYASVLNEQLVTVQKSGETVAEIMKYHSTKELGLAEEAVGALYSQTDAYMVIMSNLEGEGVNQEKEWISLAGTGYYEQIKTGEEKTLYLENDELSGKKAILSVVPIQAGDTEEKTGMLLLYYPIEEFESFIKEEKYEGKAFYCVANAAGDILVSADSFSTVFNGQNIWSAIDNSRDAERLRAKVKNGNSGIASAEDGGVQYTMVYVPTEINDWYLVAGIQQEYVDRMQAQNWNNTKMMFIKLIVTILIFFAVIISLIIVSRMRSNQKNKDLENKADTDLLTDLNNKLATERKIKEYIAQNPDKQGLLFVLDIDNFKKINDTMGHAFGDEVLSSIGHGIRGEFRVSDILGRTGGDEFMIFLKNIPDDDQIKQEADRVARFFKDFKAGEYVKYSATASIGAAVFPRDAKDFESLYKAADSALYKAKQRGKNQLAFYKD